MDSEKIKQAVTLFLEGIGEDVEREGLIETPDRVARMCEEIYGGLGKTAEEHLSKQFTVDNNDIVLVKEYLSSVKVSTSFGLAFSEHFNGDMSALQEIADKKMYEDKERYYIMTGKVRRI